MVGVVGHRDLLPDQIPQVRAAVTKILKRLREDNPDVPLRLLCSMAAGADLLAAEAAADLGITIIALLPYARRLCRADLESEAERALFDRLCDMSDVVELSLPQDAGPGDVDHPGEIRDQQLQRAGLIVARYSGLMIAIWDGLNTEHRAGTARAIQFRREGAMPTGEIAVSPRDVLLSPQDDDLNFEIRCSRLSHPNGAEVEVAVLGFTGSDSRGGEEYPSSLRTTLKRLAEFNRDVEEFADDIVHRGRRLWQPSPVLIF